MTAGNFVLTHHAVRHGYDNDGRVTHISIPSAYDYTQSYDTLGRLWKIGPGTTVEHEYQYDKASNVIHRINHVNGTSIDYVPDALNRIHDLKINVPNQPIPVGGSSRDYFTHETYGYDAMNRLTMITRDEEPAMSDQFGYYFDGELQSADYGLHWVTDHWENAAHAVDYNLDKAGNRTGTAGVTADGTAYPYAPNALNQYTNANGGTVGNGLNHEIASYDGKNYTYLNDTYLAQVSYSDVSGVHLYSLGYDALGRCVNRTTGTNSTTYYIYDGERPIYEFDSVGGTPSINVYGRGIDEILYRSNHGSGQYFEQDHEGSVIAVTGGDGTILESYRYDAFGAPTMYKPDGSVNTTGTSLINNRFLFTGREYAPQYGFYEYRARAYHPGMGRFMSEDPGLFVRGMTLGRVPSDWSFSMHPDDGELNLFRYCNNDPWDLVDPMGLEFLGYDSAGEYLHDVGQVWVGYGHAVGDTVGGLAHTVVHPITTAEGLASAVSHPLQTAQAATQAVTQSWNSGSEGQGRIVGNILIAVATAGASKAISEAGQAGKFFEGARLAPKVVAQMSNAADINHAFPGAVDAFAAKYGKWSTKIGGDGKKYEWLEMRGVNGDKAGTFRYIKDSKGNINKREFRAD